MTHVQGDITVGNPSVTQAERWYHIGNPCVSQVYVGITVGRPSVTQVGRWYNIGYSLCDPGDRITNLGLPKADAPPPKGAGIPLPLRCTH